MPSKLKNLSSSDFSEFSSFPVSAKSLGGKGPWLRSALIHGLILAGVFLILQGSPNRYHRSVDMEVIESPKTAPLPIQVSKPQVQQRNVFKHEVFGLSRRSMTSTGGETVKAGNTIAKTPDQEKLSRHDPDSLPIPSEDYLITKMPELKAETRIPYPQEAKKKGIQGAVIMDLLIDSLGQVREVTLVGGPDPDLNEAAVKAVRQFQFSPAAIHDQSVAVRIRYAYRFVLEN